MHVSAFRLERPHTAWAAAPTSPIIRSVFRVPAIHAHWSVETAVSVAFVSYTPELTKAAVFDSAVAEFATHGYTGARVDRIAAAAAVDKTAIYAYFGNKRALFEAVLARELGQLSEALVLDVRDLAGSIGAFFDYQRAHPEHIRLLMWEALEFQGQPVPGEAVRAAGYRRRFDQLAEAQRQGHADASLDPAGMWLLLAGMVNWVLALPQVTRMVLGDDPAALDRQRELLVEIVDRLIGQPRASRLSIATAESAQ